MGLRHCSDASPADWINGDRTPWPQLVSFGPAGFPAYGRLRFIPDPVRAGMEEADADLAPGWPTERQLLREALRVLQRHTTTPDECYFCVWDGWPVDLSHLAGPGRDTVRSPSVDLPAQQPVRSYFLLTGPLAEYVDPDAGWAGIPSPVEPAFVWPADRAWCVAFDVDPHYAGVGASTAAIDDLRAHPELDVVPASPDAPQPGYR